MDKKEKNKCQRNFLLRNFLTFIFCLFVDKNIKYLMINDKKALTIVYIKTYTEGANRKKQKECTEVRVWKN